MGQQDKAKIQEIFEDIYFLEQESETSLETIQVAKMKYFNNGFTRGERDMTWKEAEAEFLGRLTDEQKTNIKISYSSEEYADLEEHDLLNGADTECVTMKVEFL